VSAARRALACALVALGLLAMTAGPALAHATLLGSTPAARARGVEESRTAVVLRFSEPVQILNRSDISVVNGRGRRVDTGAARTAAGDPRRVVVPVRGPLLPESYTVR
jgi:methionine-rich copper-binding protein CopC